ncbi:MAG: hypothetical protein REI12_13135 [Pedobacter sp.]|nr:hypothetical protein [Pedobacter sp.]
MLGKDMKSATFILVTGALLVGLSACSKKDEAPPAAQEDAVTAAQYPDAAAPLNCHPQLQKLVDALPGKAEIEGQKITGRECRSGMASITYGNGEPVLVSYELTALQYAETDLEPLGQKGGQELLDNLRKTMETKIVVSESLLKGAKATAGDASVDVMKPEERLQLPREITLPNGAKAMISTQDGNDWELDAVMSERHMLVMHWLNNSKPASTDEAAAAFARLAKEVQFEKLK